jgi:hypothetical protein
MTRYLEQDVEPLLNTPIITFFNTNMTLSSKPAWFAIATNNLRKLPAGNASESYFYDSDKPDGTSDLPLILLLGATNQNTG